jgi:hypothetical protein
MNQDNKDQPERSAAARRAKQQTGPNRGPTGQAIARGQRTGSQESDFGSIERGRRSLRGMTPWSAVEGNLAHMGGTTDTELFDYDASAEVFSSTSRGRHRGRQPLSYKRFACAAEAIRFAIEDLPPQLLVGACLEVGELRYASTEIRRLYASSNYPLSRRSTDTLA